MLLVCPADTYSDPTINCGHCSTICDKAEARDNVEYCVEKCKDYYERIHTTTLAPQERSDDGGNSLKIWLPIVISLAMVCLIAGLVVYIYRWRNKNTEEMSLTRPIEETEQPFIGSETPSPQSVESTLPNTGPPFTTINHQSEIIREDQIYQHCILGTSAFTSNFIVVES
ncbi:hypothetical protein SNE40_019270 [Patella caerulea]|uniref:Uncharacterized protein n=1 Tax=Patella caerulea TaxID=87958 RepID=A0AAN8JA96_PATCE